MKQRTRGLNWRLLGRRVSPRGKNGGQEVGIEVRLCGHVSEDARRSFRLREDAENVLKVTFTS